jgi:hypothetical protein
VRDVSPPREQLRAWIRSKLESVASRTTVLVRDPDRLVSAGDPDLDEREARALPAAVSSRLELHFVSNILDAVPVALLEGAPHDNAP